MQAYTALVVLQKKGFESSSYFFVFPNKKQKSVESNLKKERNTFLNKIFYISAI